MFFDLFNFFKKKSFILITKSSCLDNLGKTKQSIKFFEKAIRKNQEKLDKFDKWLKQE